LSSFFSSRCCSLFSCFVNFSAGEVEAAFGEDVDPTVADGDAEGIGSILRGLNLCAWDLNLPCGACC